MSTRSICTSIGAALLFAVAREPAAAPERDVHAEITARDPAACAGCHAEIVAEWSASAHAIAWTDPIFQAEYAVAPEASCRGCHAPASHGGPVDAVAAQGVDCAACHEREGKIVAFAADVFAQSSACGTCHDFAFPDHERRYAPGDPLQRTLAEWTESRAAERGRGCVDCHMPRGSHRVLGLDDAEFLARAVDVDVAAVRSSEGVAVTVQLRSANIGHAFPTGDVFRVARVEVEADGATAHAELTRTFDWQPDDAETEMFLREIADTRLAADTTQTIALLLPRPDAKRVHWRLVLDRLDPDLATQRGLTNVTHELAHGEVDVNFGRSSN